MFYCYIAIPIFSTVVSFQLMYKDNKLVGTTRNTYLRFFSKYTIYNESIDLKNVDKWKTDSERSDECIDFTMIITSRNNAPISNFGGGFQCKSEYPGCIIEVKS
ncbi:Uncharacterized protein FWK35_00003934 [Aphis craccivora]|uniref:Uncharacterized protein n=1 Tax=Aphis craccivora TaxID=307492 RepID=A0A6G0Z3A7_APHCR|nr:Uncharacterized protein FWK35_00003934 [Aphis craccivora]